MMQAEERDQNNSLTSLNGGANMVAGYSPADLKNEICAKPTVQAAREITTANGCHVCLFFKKEHDPGIRKEIARLFLAAFTKERNDDSETSHVPVQGIDKGAG